MFLRMSKTAQERAEEREAMWKERVRQWKESGKTAKEFASKNGCSPSALHWWARWFAKIEAPGFLRLVPKSAAAASGGATSTVTVEVHGAQIKVVPGFDPTLLAQVVQALDGGAR
jgi:hypothetical protein